MVAATAAHTSTTAPWTETSYSTTTAAPDDHLEQEQLDRDRGGLAQEDRSAVESRQPQAVARAIRFLDRERPPDRQQDGEEHRGPEQSRRGSAQQRAVGIEREREEHHDDAAERNDLLQRDARPPFDAQVLARDEERVAQEAHACASSSAGTGAAARRIGRNRVHLARDDAHLTRGQAARELELVRREHHRAILARGAARTTSSSTSRPCSSRPACGSSSRSRRGLRASALASDSRRRCPCDSRPCATSATRCRPDPFDARRRRRPRL